MRARVLGIEVSAALLADWRAWLAPGVQPFFVSPSDSDAPDSADHQMTAEMRDTFQVYNVKPDLRTAWLDEAAFAALPRRTRAHLVRVQVTHGRGAVPTVRAWEDLLDPAALRAQADGHRFVWWPSLLPDDDREILARAIPAGRRTSRHAEVVDTTWARCRRLLPDAHRLAGTFPWGSGPNCFGTVMGTCGVPDAADTWILQAPFETWLSQRTRPGGDDTSPGTVLVWRDDEGAPKHAAVTIGDGWAIEKPSQEWSSPRAIVAVRDVIVSARTPGWRLQRRTVSAHA